MNFKFNGAYFSNRKRLLMNLMRIFIFIFCTSLFAFTPSNIISQNSKVKIEESKELSVDEIFDLIMDQSDYKFFYQEGMFKDVPKVKVEKGIISTNDLLKRSLSNGNFEIEVTENNVILIKEVPESTKKKIQQHEISGTVTDIDGMPLPGASVIVKGTSTGVTTDFDGKFSLSVQNDATTLTVSFLGYASQEIEINGLTTINIQMTPTASALDEVVIVGYGSTKSKNVSGAIEQVNITDIGDRPGGNIATSLQGLMPGVTVQFNNGDPRAGADINIRGFNSINGGSALVLVDGIQGNLNILNPEDIKSITILKDAASAAIYGARGAFGVVLVTTKKGREGDIKIDFSSNIGFTTPTARTDYISDPVLYGKTIDAALFGYNGKTLTGYTNDEDWNRLQQVADGVVAPWRELQANGTYKFYDSTDWYDYLYKDVTTSMYLHIF